MGWGPRAVGSRGRDWSPGQVLQDAGVQVCVSLGNCGSWVPHLYDEEEDRMGVLPMEHCLNEMEHFI